jgi:acyl carrier protein
MTRVAITEAVLASLAELLGEHPDRIKHTDRLSDLGVDSMVAVNLLVEIEGRLGARLPEGSELQLLEAQTVRELAEKVEQALATRSSVETPSR